MTDDTKSPERKPKRTRHPRKLNDAQKRYVVQRLAAHDSPTRIAQDVRRRFGVSISRLGVAHYDPTRGAHCGQKWAAEFIAARKAHDLARSSKPLKVARTEQLALAAMEILARRVLQAVEAEGRRMHAGRPDEMSDNDRIRALIAVMRKLKASDHARYAGLSAALHDSPDTLN